MKQTFEDLEEYSNYIKNEKVAVATTIFDGIEKAIKNNHKEASIFEIYFDNEEYVYDISVEKEEWIKTLESCLDIFTENEVSNKAIEAFQLLEVARELFKED